MVNPGSENNLKETDILVTFRENTTAVILHVARLTWLWTNQRRCCHLANLIGHCFGGTEFPFFSKVPPVPGPEELFLWCLVYIYNIQICSFKIQIIQIPGSEIKWTRF